MNFRYFANKSGLSHLSRFLCIVALANPLQALPANDALDHIIAVIDIGGNNGNDVIMMSELEEKVRTIVGQLRESNSPIPPQAALEQQILDRIVLNKLQLLMAKRTGIRVDDETLNRSVSNIAAENGVSLKEFRDILAADGYSFEKFREDIRNEISISRLQQRQIVNRINVTDKEIENFLKTEEHQGLSETEYSISHILVSVSEGSSEEELEQGKLLAEKTLDELKSGQNFAKMAASVSDGQQATNGGDLGWRTKSQIPSLFSAHISEMKQNDISEIIRSASGFHIIKLNKIRSSDKSIVKQTLAKHILIRIDEITNSPAAQEKLQQFLYRIEQGEDFSTIARSHSEDTVSALDGGNLGWRSPGELVPQFEEAMNALKPGQISEPFQTQFGWHIVTVNERRNYDNTENAKQTRVRDIIRKRKIEESQQDWLRRLEDEHYIEKRLNEE